MLHTLDSEPDAEPTCDLCARKLPLHFRGKKKSSSPSFCIPQAWPRLCVGSHSHPPKPVGVWDSCDAGPAACVSLWTPALPPAPTWETQASPGYPGVSPRLPPRPGIHPETRQSSFPRPDPAIWREGQVTSPRSYSYKMMGHDKGFALGLPDGNACSVSHNGSENKSVTFPVGKISKVG